MIKLSDYLDYLNAEIIQARKKADEYAVFVAKQYADHEYLKYFKVPRYSMPSVKMDIPVKITDIDSDTKYSFNDDKILFLKNVNEKIAVVNKEKNLKIQPLTEKEIDKPEVKLLLADIKKNTENKNINEIKVGVKSIDFSKQIKAINVGRFRVQDSGEDEAMKMVLSEAVMKNFQVKSSRLNNIFIDPDTSTKSEDKEKIFLNLHVEMEEEGIRIVRLEGRDGKKIEEIVFE